VSDQFSVDVQIGATNTCGKSSEYYFRRFLQKIGGFLKNQNQQFGKNCPFSDNFFGKNIFLTS
jgi:hypothetical protein